LSHSLRRWLVSFETQLLRVSRSVLSAPASKERPVAYRPANLSPAKVLDRQVEGEGMRLWEVGSA